MGVLETAVAAVVLAAVQVVPRFVPDLDEHGQRWVLSATAGFGVGYVFIYLLPEVGEMTDVVGDEVGGLLPFTDQEGHLLALVGLVVFYGLERLARRASRDSDRPSAGRADDRVGMVVLAVFALYYALIGYLLWYQPDETIGGFTIFTVAMGMHFLGINVGLREQPHDLYVKVGRWVLSVAVLAGWSVGAIGSLPSAVLAALLSLVAGGIVLIALKEELPAESEGRFLPFVAGVAVAVALMTAV